jgi:hypothetical protein
MMSHFRADCLIPGDIGAGDTAAESSETPVFQGILKGRRGGTTYALNRCVPFPPRHGGSAGRMATEVA